MNKLIKQRVSRMAATDMVVTFNQGGKMKTDEILQERGKTYGKFVDHARLTQDLKEAMYKHPNYARLEPYQKESLEMVQHKIGRIINGDPMYLDSWADGAGYFELAVKELQGKGV